MSGPSLGLFAETLRRAHCAHARSGEPDHACVGRVTVERSGTTFDCRACGPGAEPLAPTEFEARRARAVVEAVGLSWSSLTPEAQSRAVAALERASR